MIRGLLDYGKTYYIVRFDNINQEYEVISRVINHVEEYGNEKKSKYYYFKDGAVLEDCIFNRLHEAIGKCNRMNMSRIKIPKGTFYKGRVMWVRYDDFGYVKSFIIDTYGEISISRFKARPVPNTEVGKTNPNLEKWVDVSKINSDYAFSANSINI